MKNKFFKSQFIFGLIIIIILSFIPLLWFKGNQIIVGDDNVFPLQVSNFIRDRLFTWSLNHGLGYDQASGIGSIIIHSIDTAGFNLGTSLQMSEKITYIFWTFAMLFSSFMLAWFLEKWGFIKTKYLKFIFPVLYAFNFYTLEAWWIGERTKFSLMVAMPIFLLFLISLIQSKKPVWVLVLLSTILFTIFNGGGWKGLPLYGGTIIIIGTYVLYSIFSAKEKILSRSVTYIKFFFAFFTLFILINAYSIFPFFTHTLAQYQKAISSSGGPSVVFGWIDMISQYTSYMNLFRFEGIPEWYNNPSHPYASAYLNAPILIFVSFLFPTLILLSFLFKKEKQEKSFYLYIIFVLLISLFFIAGSHPPLGFIFNLFIVKIPGFAIFRTPLYKFGYAFWFAGAYLISYTLSKCIELFEKKSFSFIKFKFGFISTGIIIIGLLLYHFPLLTGNFFSWSSGQLENRVTIPSYIYQVGQWADHKNDSYRIFMLPNASPNWNADVYTWKFFSLYPITADLSRQPFLYNHDGLTADEAALINGLYDAILEKNTDRILAYSKLLKTKYFIVRNDYFSSLSWAQTKSPQQYTDAIKENSLFSFIKSFGKWDIYVLNADISDNHVAAYNTITEYNANFLNSVEIEADTNKGAMSNVFVNSDIVEANPSLQSYAADKIFSFPCITCQILTRDNSITFPKVWFYPDSPFYKVGAILKTFKKQPLLFGETELFDILGRTLISTQQISDMVNYSGSRKEQKDDATVISFSELTNYYNKINSWIEKNYITDQSKIYYSPMIINYINVEEIIIARDLSKKVDSNELRSKPYYASYATYLQIYQNLLDKLKFNEENTNYFTDKVFYPLVKGDYNTYLRYQDNASANTFNNVSLQVNSSTVVPLSQKNNYISYGNVSYTENMNKVSGTINFTNLTESTHLERNNVPLEIGSNICVGSDIQNIKQNQSFSINYSYLNDFSNNLQFVVFTKDIVKNSQVLYSKYLSFDDKDQFSKQMTFSALQNYNDVFVGFCANEINSYIYANKLKIETYPVVSPMLVIYQKEQNKKTFMPQISINRINQTKYIVTISHASSPFILSFFEQFDPDWKAYITNSTHSQEHGSTGDTILEKGMFDTWFIKPIPSIDHFTVNGYMNGWYVDKAGNYSIIIEYQPQKLFYQGSIVSIITLIGIGLFLLIKKIKS